MEMSVSMAAMMVPTAAPFFFAYGRDVRRPAGVALLVIVYAAAWALIGVAVDRATGEVMLPSTWPAGVVAITVAAAYTATPWSRWARSRCREMCGREPRGRALTATVAEGFRYTACCVVCSAGVMVAVLVLGMSNLLVVVAAAVVMLALKSL